jgi:hypothetical protein
LVKITIDVEIETVYLPGRNLWEYYIGQVVSCLRVSPLEVYGIKLHWTYLPR